MNHKKCINVLENLHHGKEIQPEDISQGGITAKNMEENYRVIEKFLKENFNDAHKFKTFVYYFLTRIVMVEIEVEKTNASMIFEVMNDRGVRLKSYEILKGKLLSQIDKEELERDGYNEIWDDQVKKSTNMGKRR